MRITGNGIWGEPPDRAGAIRILRRAVELGINFIDPAASYGPGVSEEIIAEGQPINALRQHFFQAVFDPFRRPVVGEANRYAPKQARLAIGLARKH